MRNSLPAKHVSIVLLVGVLLVTTVNLWSQMHREDQPPQEEDISLFEFTNTLIKVDSMINAGTAPAIIRPVLLRLLRATDPNTDKQFYIMIRNGLISCDMLVGDVRQGLQQYRGLIDTARLWLGNQHLQTAALESNLGYLYLQISQYDSAAHYFKVAIPKLANSIGTEHPDYIAVLSNLAHTEQNRGYYDDALELLRTALYLRVRHTGAKSQESAAALSNLGSYFLDLGGGDPLTAIKYFEKSYSILTSIQKGSTWEKAIMLSNIATAYQNIGRYRVALRYKLHAHEIRKEVLGSSSRKSTASHKNLASIYIHLGQSDIARYHLKQIETNDGRMKDPRYDGWVYQYQGWMDYYVAMGDRDSVLWAGNHAIEKSNLIFGRNATKTAYTKVLIGLNLYKLGATRQSLPFIQCGLQFLARRLGNKNSYIQTARISLASIYMDLDKLDSARNQLDTVLVSFGIDGIQGVVATEFYSHVNYRMLIRGLKIRAEYFTAKADTKPNPSAWVMAFTAYEETIEQIPFYQWLHGGTESMPMFFEEFEEMWDRALDLAYTAQEHGVNRSRVHQFVLNIINLKKATKLRDLMQESMAFSVSNVPDSLINRLLETRKMSLGDIEPESWESDISEPRNDDFVAFDQEIKDILNVIEKEAPAYFELRFRNPQVQLGSIQETLDPANSIIMYYYTDSLLYALGFDHEKSVFRRLPWGPVEALCTRFVELCHETDVDPTVYARTGSVLYEKLLKPFERVLHHDLQILPYGTLAKIPFEALLTKLPNAQTGFHDLPYVVREHAVSYSPYLLTNPTNNNFSVDPKNVVGFAPFASIAVDTQLHLPASYQEASKAMSIIGGNWYFDAKATTQQFAEILSNVRILHLATHFQVDGNHPESSVIYLADEDGKAHSLSIWKILDQRPPLTLAFLSGCSSASGKDITGEGVASIARMFQYVGATSTIANLWPVSDATGPGLTYSFYGELEDGRTGSGALAQAKRNFLKSADSELAKPYYWASSVYYGPDDLHIYFEGGARKRAIGFIALAILALGITIHYWKLFPKDR